VFVVASARDDINPTEILFEFEGLRRDTPKSRKAGQEVAASTDAGFDSGGLQRTVGALCADTHPGAYSGQDAYTGRLIPQPIAFENSRRDGARLYDNVSNTLQAFAGTGGGNGPMVALPIPIHDQATRHAGKNGDKTMGKGNGLGIGQPGDPMNTLTKGDSHAVAYNIAPGKGELKDDIHVTDAHVSKTIDASGSNPAMHQGGAAIVQPVEVNSQTAWSMNLMSPGRQIREDHGVGALTQDAHRPTQGNEAVVIQQAMAVRRLTPVECERLQGFPDNYSNIPWRKAAESPDGPRYKALGNSWAVPVVAWIGKRIQDQLK